MKCVEVPLGLQMGEHPHNDAVPGQSGHLWVWCRTCGLGDCTCFPCERLHACMSSGFSAKPSNSMRTVLHRPQSTDRGMSRTSWILKKNHMVQRVVPSNDFGFIKHSM